MYDCPVYGYSTLGGGCEGALLSSPAPSPANPCTDGADHQITLLQDIELSLFTVTVTDVSSKKKVRPGVPAGAAVDSSSPPPPFPPP